MIEATQLTKSLAAVRAVSEVSFTVQKGEAVGFVGPNGAGKTTSFRMLAGILAPDSGRVSVMGIDLATDPINAKRQIGYMAESAPLYPELTGLEYLSYRAELRGVKKSARAQLVLKAAEKAGAHLMLGVRIGHLSKGYRQRMALADALLGDPVVVLLDEPTSGLDPNQVLETRKLIRELAKDHAVLLSTHVLSEVEATCSRAIVIDRGRVVAQGRLDELKQLSTKDRALLHVQGKREAVDRIIAELQREATLLELRDITPNKIQLELRLHSETSLSRVVRALVESGLELEQATHISTPLDEVFAHLTVQAEPVQQKSPSKELL